jgi:hypothetical protein
MEGPPVRAAATAKAAEQTAREKRAEAAAATRSQLREERRGRGYWPQEAMHHLRKYSTDRGNQ